MKISLKKAFSILDGRLSTEMGDVYEMLNFIFNADFMTHQLPTAIRTLQAENPDWFRSGVIFINNIKEEYATEDFQRLMEIIDRDYSSIQIELGKVDIKIDCLAGLEKFIK